jgi:hypothetical protein
MDAGSVLLAFGVRPSIGRLVSAGLERLVYTEKVGGSNPSAPTAVVDSMCIAGPVVSGGSSFLPWQTS